MTEGTAAPCIVRGGALSPTMSMREAWAIYHADADKKLLAERGRRRRGTTRQRNCVFVADAYACHRVRWRRRRHCARRAPIRLPPPCSLHRCPPAPLSFGLRLTTVAAVLYVAADAASRRPPKGSASRYVASHPAGSSVGSPTDGWRVALSGRRAPCAWRQSLCHCGVTLRCCRWVGVPQCHS